MAPVKPTKSPILSEAIDKDLAAKKLVEILQHGLNVIIDIDGVHKDRVACCLYQGDNHLAWVTVDDVPVYRALLLPDLQSDENGDKLVVAGHGTWLPSYRQFLNEVDPGGSPPDDIEDAELVDDDKTDPDVNPLAN